MGIKRVYLDYAATTPMAPEVQDSMRLYEREEFGNPSSVHEFGIRSRTVIEEARATIAQTLNVEMAGIIFTGSGTEADNIALQGLMVKNLNQKPHLITTIIEHPAIYNTAIALKEKGFDITIVPVKSNGIVDPSEIESKIKPTTKLISVQYVNNEIGTIQPIQKIAEIARNHQIFFHSDAIQAFGKLHIDMKSQKIDLLSIAGHKVYGPKGIGALCCNPTTFSDDQGVFRIQNYISPLIYGGSQEFGLRPATENVTGIVGFAKASELAIKNMKNERIRIQKLRDNLISHILSEIPDVLLNGDPNIRLFNNANFSFSDLNGFDLMLFLDSNGIAVSTGSACSSKTQTPSRVLTALGLDKYLAHGSIRMTLGKENTQEEIDYVLEVLPKCVRQARYIYKQ